MKRILALAVFVVFVAGASAAACTNISTLNISDSSGRPGDRVEITGSSFGNSAPAGRRTGEPLPVRIRWNGVQGPTLAEVVADGAGNISAAMTIPDATPGHYVIFAVQQDRDGYHMYGTPARVAYEVLTPDGRSVPFHTSNAAETAGAALGDASIPALLAVLGLLGGALFFAAFVTFVRLLSSPRAASASRVRST